MPPNPIPTCPGSIAIYCQDVCPCFQCLCISFLLLNSVSCLYSDAGFPPSLPDILHLGIERCCAQRKTFLKICQHFSAPMSLKAVPQGMQFFKRVKAFLKSELSTLFLARPISLKVMNSTTAWLLPPRLPPILTSLMSSSVLVSNKSSKTPPLAEASITWIEKLSSTRS